MLETRDTEWGRFCEARLRSSVKKQESETLAAKVPHSLVALETLMSD